MSNRFDEKYEIRLAYYKEIPEVMIFIDRNWKKNHILATNREFFEYEMVVDGIVNFLIAKNKENGEIEGILGFLPCSKDKSRLDIWGVIWMTVPTAMPMLGMEMKKRLMEITGARTDLGVGANPEISVPLLGRIYHYYTAKMKHYYRLADIDEYKVAVVNNKFIPDYEKYDEVLIIKIGNKAQLQSFFDFSTIESCIPYKDSWYYDRRFFKHPIYHYDVWGIDDAVNKSIMVTRIQECNHKTVARIVDYSGEQSLFGKIGGFLDNLLINNEYVDFYFDGFEEKYVKEAGMIEADDGENIIPDYFNPFAQINVDIYVDSSNNKERCLFFKADGDQDRPN